MNRHSLTWLRAGAGIALALLVANIALTYRNTWQLREDAFREAHTHAVINGFTRALTLISDAETNQRGYVITGEPQYLDRYTTTIASINAAVDDLQRLTADNPRQQARFPDLRERIALRLRCLQETIAARDAEGIQASRTLILTERGKQAMEAVRQTISEMTQHEESLLRERSGISQRAYQTAVLTGFLSGLSALAAVAGLVLLQRRHSESRGRAAAVIAEQAERLRTTLASIGDAVITTDTAGTIVNLNAVAESLTGWTNLEAAGQPLASVFRIVNETTRQLVENPAARALTEGVIVGLANHTVLIAKDGSERPIDDSAAPIRCQAGEIVGCVLVFRDVSTRRRSEQELRASEARKTAMFETALDCIISIDHEGSITEFNAAAESTFGYGRQDVIGRELAEIIIPPAYRERHRQGLARYLTTGVGPVLNQRLELSALRADGSEFPVELTVTRIPVDGPPSFTAYLRDITQRKLVDEKLQQNERRLRFIMDSMPQKIFTARASGEVDYFNPIWTEFTGLSFEQIRDWGWKQFIHPDDLEENLRIWQHALQTGEPFHCEHRFRRADGEYRWHLSHARAMKDSEGKVLLWIGSNSDVHEQKQTADALRLLAAELSEADRRKNEFLAMLAHELRNPLAPIRNALQIVRLANSSGESSTALDSPLTTPVEMIERQISQLVRLVDDLLDVSRISRGKIDLRRERVDLATVIQQAVETCRPAIDAAQHELTVTLPPEAIALHADPLRLAQAFSNLLSNACKYSEPGGRITVTAQREGSDVVVSFKDTGIGIPEGMLPKIFEMFTQVDRSLERSQSGLGIGLTLVQRLVELHGGSVSAQSEGPGRGSEFIVRLPVESEEDRKRKDTSQARSAQSSPVTPHRSAPLRILVVDDNRDAAISLAMLLKITGHETHLAHDGQEALEKAQADPPDAILLDIGMPKLNGYEVCRRIREQAWGKQIAIIALTGWGQDEDRQKSQAAGFNAHLVKPVDHSALAKLLTDLTAKH